MVLAMYLQLVAHQSPSCSPSPYFQEITFDFFLTVKNSLQVGGANGRDSLLCYLELFSFLEQILFCTRRFGPWTFISIAILMKVHGSKHHLLNLVELCGRHYLLNLVEL